MTCTSYCGKIEEIFDAMIRLSDEVLQENRNGVNEYISRAWTGVIIFTGSIKQEDGTGEHRSKFQSHVEAEEERIRKNLEDIKYDIDGYDSVHVVSERGRVPMASEHRRIETVWSFLPWACIQLNPEQTLFPMLYLLLQRDLQKIGLARKHVLSDSELPDALDTIRWVITAAWYRMEDLTGEKGVTLPIILADLAHVVIFKHQGLSPKEQFATHAESLVGVTISWISPARSDRHLQYRIASEGDGFYGDKLRELPDPIPANSDIIPDQESIPLSVLNHPIGKKHEIDFAAYDSPTPAVPSSVDGPDAA